jgi:glycosyltransferase involved in cell wall biosynthesis
MNNIRVLYIVERLNIGGMEQISTQLASCLNSGNFSTEMYCLSAGGPFAERLRKLGIPVTIFSYHRYLLPWNIASLARHIRRGNFQIIHTHTYSAGMLGRIAGFCAGVPVIIHHHHSTAKEFEWWRQRLLERFVTRCMTDKVITVSDAAKHFLLSYGFGTDNKISVIYNGVEESFAAPSGQTMEIRTRFNIDNKKVIVTTASLTSHKGHTILIEALTSVIKQFPDTCCIFLGDGIERSALEIQARDSGISKHVIFAGVQHDIRPFLEVANLFVLPSLRESMGIAIVEAMAKKCAVVASNIDGIPEVVVDTVTGLLAIPGSPSDFALKITTLLGDPVRTRLMGEEGYRIFCERFTLEKSVDSVRELYYSCLTVKKVIGST